MRCARAALVFLLAVALAIAACAPDAGAPSPSGVPSSAAPPSSVPSAGPVPDAAVAWILYQRPDCETEHGRNGAVMRLRPGRRGTGRWAPDSRRS